MKKIIAVLLIAVLALGAAACGGKTPAETTTESQTETTTDPAVTEPEIGRIGEKGAFYVYIPDQWCKMEYSGDSTRLRLFDTPSAPKIEEGKTAEVEIRVGSDAAEKTDVDAAAAELLKTEGAKKGKDFTIDGEPFTVVTYTDAAEKRVYTTYVGLGGGTLATVTLKGIAPDNENAAAILRSISFKAINKRTEETTVAKPATTAAAKPATTAAAKPATTAAAKPATTAAQKTTAAAKPATTAAQKTTAAAKPATTAAQKTTATAKPATTAAKTTAAAG